MAMTRMGRDEIFLAFVIIECANALSAIEDVRQLAAARERVAPDVERLQNGTVFRAIRLALQSSANVSKIFWPQRTSGDHAKRRAENLRAVTGIPENHGLSNRALRNHIEHMDERLDDWTQADPRPFLTFELVIHAGDRGAPEKHAILIESTAIVYDAEADEVLLFGETFSLAQLHADVLAVRDAASNGMASLIAK
jgi:hypothetical protein